MAPVVLSLRAQAWADTVVVASGQHRDMLSQALSIFGLSPDVDLDLMQENQTLAELSSRLLTGLDRVLERQKPELVVAQGDTSTVMACALASFYRRIPFAHVEAGLRTHDLANPFPEEFNRRIASQVAAVHFAPTEQARSNLLAENVNPGSVHVTGNTVIDALHAIVARQPSLPSEAYAEGRVILITAHRRENFGAPLLRICEAIARLHRTFTDVTFIYPVHPNPNVADVVRRELGRLERVRLIAPLNYEAFIALLDRCTLTLTDSGGVQEEAPALGKPVLVMRETTERPEAVERGVAKLVGTDVDLIYSETFRLLTDASHYVSMSKGGSPYGDGHAGERIVAILGQMLVKCSPNFARP